MLHKFLLIQFLLMPFCMKGQIALVDNQAENTSLQEVVLAYKDTSHELTIQQILDNQTTQFKPISHLNIGITYANYWLKFTVVPSENKETKLFLAFESVVNDSIYLYKVVHQKVIEIQFLGEYLPFSTRKIKHQTPIFEINIQPDEQAQYYIKTMGNGQPMNLTAKLLNAQGFHIWDIKKTFFLGIVYGILSLIILLNFSFFLITQERIYIIFSLQVIFSTLCILYFDGFIYQYIFPNSGYWSNETIAIAMCLTFVCNNRFTTDFFNLKALVPWAYKTFQYFTWLIISILAFSFVHPLGFNTFIISMTAATSLVALLLFVSILTAKNRGFSSYFFVLIATLCLIIFGSIFQLFLIGRVQGIFITHYAMHLAVVTQSVFLALAVNDKFRIIKEENAYFQVKLVETLNQYSQNLISNIEAERQRLAVDIHDGLGQNLLTIRNKILRTLKKKSLASEMQETLYSLLDITTETLDDARAMSYNLRPPILNTMGLTVAIETLVAKMKGASNLKISLQMEDSIDGVVQKEYEINIYRILQECFNNVIKHAKASKIDLKIIKNVSFLTISFQDNGIGYNQNVQINGQGILGIKERVALLNGTININSEEGSGTLLSILIPIKNL